MNKSIFAVAAGVALSLTGCRTIDDMKVNISPDLNSRATMYNVVQPRGMINNQSYHQVFGDFAIDGVDFSWSKTTSQRIDRSLAEWSKDVANAAFLFLVFDIRDHYPGFWDKNKLMTQRDFSFDLHQHGATVHADCRLLSVETETVYDRDNDNRPTEYSISRDQSTLGCVFTENGQISELLVDTPKEQPARMRLRHGTAPLELTVLKGMQMLSGGKWEQPGWAGPYSVHGMSFRSEGVEQGAVSLLGPFPKIWLDNKLTVERQRLLATASYSLIMYNWLDGMWTSDLSLSGIGNALQNPVPLH
jgi:hypothetical protein